ncbi:Rap1a/Tai family immunity protein [Bradyrhizobium ottawaense]|uniref:Rap1a/Tai family immunity protein n=1 Tax=Bradyrhizobium ottawaense TaxID=931866 RepID=UPI001260330C|nr:Rap1a/Tai family immunity protein [Bradyrhizobium ottawaense]
MRLRLAAVASLMLLYEPQRALALSGAELYQACNEKNDSAGDLFCNAYMRGFLEGMTTGIGIREALGASAYCPPQEQAISVTQGRLIAKQYFRENPQKLHTDAALILGLALIQAFPCGDANWNSPR